MRPALADDQCVPPQSPRPPCCADPGRNIYGRTKESTGCCITKTTTLIIIATHPASVSTANCVTEVEKMADYLISMQM